MVDKETPTLWGETEKLLLICAKFFALTDAYLKALQIDIPNQNFTEMCMVLGLIKTYTAGFIESVREAVRLFDLMEKS